MSSKTVDPFKIFNIKKPIVQKHFGPTPDQQKKVIQLYRKCFRLSRNWEGPDEEKKYIKEEAQRLFKANKDLKFLEDIDERIDEVEKRIGLAEHYKIPYPKFQNDALLLETFQPPVYMRSYYDGKKTTGE